MKIKNANSTQPTQSRQSDHLAASTTPLRKPGKPLKTHSPDSADEVTPDQIVRLHDLAGLVVISLPEALKDIIGEEAFKRRLEELNRHEFRLIVREPGDVVYINMPIYAMADRADMQPKTSAKVQDTDGKSKGNGSAKSRGKSKKKSKPAVKPSRKAKANSVLNPGGNQ